MNPLPGKTGAYDPVQRDSSGATCKTRKKPWKDDFLVFRTTNLLPETREKKIVNNKAKPWFQSTFACLSKPGCMLLVMSSVWLHKIYRTQSSNQVASVEFWPVWSFPTGYRIPDCTCARSSWWQKLHDQASFARSPRLSSSTRLPAHSPIMIILSSILFPILI